MAQTSSFNTLSTVITSRCLTACISSSTLSCAMLLAHSSHLCPTPARHCSQITFWFLFLALGHHHSLAPSQFTKHISPSHYPLPSQHPSSAFQKTTSLMILRKMFLLRKTPLPFLPFQNSPLQVCSKFCLLCRTWQSFIVAIFLALVFTLVLH